MPSHQTPFPSLCRLIFTGLLGWLTPGLGGCQKQAARPSFVPGPPFPTPTGIVPFTGTWQYVVLICQPAPPSGKPGGLMALLQAAHASGSVTPLPRIIEQSSPAREIALANQTWNAFLDHHFFATPRAPKSFIGYLGNLWDTDPSRPGFASLFLDPQAIWNALRRTPSPPAAATTPAATIGPLQINQDTGELLLPGGTAIPIEFNIDPTNPKNGGFFLWAGTEAKATGGPCALNDHVWLGFFVAKSLLDPTERWARDKDLEAMEQAIVQRLKKRAKQAADQTRQALLTQIEAELAGAGALTLPEVKHHSLTEKGVTQTVGQWKDARDASGGTSCAAAIQALKEELEGGPPSPDGSLGAIGLITAFDDGGALYDSDPGGNIGYGLTFDRRTQTKYVIARAWNSINRLSDGTLQASNPLAKAVLDKYPRIIELKPGQAFTESEFNDFKQAAILLLEASKLGDYGVSAGFVFYDSSTGRKAKRDEIVQKTAQLKHLETQASSGSVLTRFVQNLKVNPDHALFQTLGTAASPTAGRLQAQFATQWQRWNKYQNPTFDWSAAAQAALSGKETWKPTGTPIPTRSADGSFQSIHKPSLGGALMDAAVDPWSVDLWELGLVQKSRQQGTDLEF